MLMFEMRGGGGDGTVRYGLVFVFMRSHQFLFCSTQLKVNYLLSMQAKLNFLIRVSGVRSDSRRYKRDNSVLTVDML